MKITINEDELKQIIAKHVEKRVGQHLNVSEQDITFVHSSYSHELIEVYVYLDNRKENKK